MSIQVEHDTTLWLGFTFAYRPRPRRFDPASYALTPRLASVAAAG